MSGKFRLLRILGIVLLFVPFLGVPGWMKTLCTILIALVVIYLSYTIRFGLKKLLFQLRPQSSDEAEPTIHG